VCVCVSVQCVRTNDEEDPQHFPLNTKISAKHPFLHETNLHFSLMVSLQLLANYKCFRLGLKLIQ